MRRGRGLVFTSSAGPVRGGNSTTIEAGANYYSIPTGVTTTCISACRIGSTNIINALLSGVALTDARISVYQIGNTHQYIGSRSYTHTIKRTFNHNLPANVATSVFRIPTTDESGNTDSGA